MAIQIVDADFVKGRIGDVAILDVRTPDEFVEGHIPSALNVSINRDGPAPGFVEAVERLVQAKDEPLIIYCRKGIRAAHAADLLDAAGYEHIFDYCGSWLDWVVDPSRPVAQ